MIQRHDELLAILTRVTRWQVLYNWRQICRNSLVIFCTLDTKRRWRRWHTAKCSATHFSNCSQSNCDSNFAQFKCDWPWPLEWANSQMVSTLASPSNAVQCSGRYMNGTLSAKQSLAGNLFCCKYRLYHTWTRPRHTWLAVCCCG